MPGPTGRVTSYQPVYSAQFIVYTDAAPNTTYEVPAGATAVIRDFSAIATVAATLVQVTIQDSATAPACIVASLELAGLEQYAQWVGRVVIPAGGIITLNLGSLSAGVSSYVGGYLLTNVAP